ncbi:hypothetical protein OSB04_031664 [Centaurea solstitialis]|uniref:Uncharacterized protein n=1 Tax=Centaurea solstitialis TaxID=347529 RepID=A0AA38SM41_9ASTR|nr:hypothetical protein OSB04_031664 [Centaurea solstitialis]
MFVKQAVAFVCGYLHYKSQLPPSDDTLNILSWSLSIRETILRVTRFRSADGGAVFGKPDGYFVNFYKKMVGRTNH